MSEPCPACTSKDGEIRWLREQLRDITTKVAEMISPGVVARQSYRPATPREPSDPRRAVSHSPAAMRSLRADRPAEVAPVPASVSRAEIEASFRVPDDPGPAA